MFPEQTKQNKIQGVISNDEKFEYLKSVQINIFRPQQNIEDKFNFNLIESVNSNIKFGGFYNGSINIQFSPAMYIKPFSFLSINAIHQKNLFIPMKELEENMVSLAVETTGMVAVENAINIFAPPNKIIRGIAQFTLKNCISFLIYSLFNSGKKENGVLKDDFYYFSAGITF